MSRLLRTTPVDAPFSSIIEYVAQFFEEHSHLRLEAIAPASTSVETRYELIDDRVDTVRRHDALALSWNPRWALFPSFDGCITVRPHAAGGMLALEGTYEPPGGLLGSIFDRLLGKRLAYRTLDRLLRALREYVEARYTAFQSASPSIEQLNEAARISGK